MTNLLERILLNAALFLGFMLLPASALAQQEVNPTYYDPVPTATVEHSAKTANNDKALREISKEQHRSKVQKHTRRNNNAQQLVAKK